MKRGDDLLYLFIDFFVNLCVLIALIFIYLKIIWKLDLRNKSLYYTGIIHGAAGGVLGCILLNFSIEISGVDLRFIPVLLLVMYAGAFPSMIGASIIIIERLMLVLDVHSSAVASLLLMILLVIGFIVINKLARNGNPYKKGLWMTLFYNSLFSIMLVFLVQDLRGNMTLDIDSSLPGE
ncbi:hypothetical protein [Gracilibacillus alcaliphilus]|uniref:hypothetical protein n=1 Tax=Gracilibacillus alcaliphilus TaxID=1401441 RepID=UPI00195E0BEE|nr:hypothetical protein [Gracilibacillus alcaliphilus]MBM7677504.1 hypothetical protein [Gracilibacillus alcaliphilus]